MKTPDFKELSMQYVKAFDACDLAAVAELMADDFSLTDPEVRDLSPQSEVIAYISGIFESVSNDVSFSARQILADGARTVIEFDLRIGETQLEGTDVIDWSDGGKMRAMRAYLTNVSGN